MQILTSTQPKGGGNANRTGRYIAMAMITRWLSSRDERAEVDRKQSRHDSFEDSAYMERIREIKDGRVGCSGVTASTVGGR